MVEGTIGLAVLAVVLAVVFFGRARSAGQRIGELDDALARLSTEHSAVEQELARERRARAKQADELAGYRKRADKARRREAKPSAPPLGTQARIADLQSELAGATRERDRLSAECESLRSELETARRRPEPSKVVAVPVPAEPEPEPERERLQADLAEARERLGKLEGELEGARLTEARMRKRMANQEQLYASLRAELEVKKDRLRTQEERIQRLQALKVALE